MDQIGSVQNRRSRRSNVFMTATLEFSGASLDVKLRNLSAEGALVESEHLPVDGAAVVFRRQELSVAGRVAWTRGKQAGIAFDSNLAPEAVLRHIPSPKPRVTPEFRRPGLSSRQLTSEERKLGSDWMWRPGFDLPGE
ncbi:PilZ domain-containing protein [Sphingomonas ginkgonis]|uniref:PilZ domain-containing protein n=1 Tax=Sphingomonas ginkgonis TaxID=2315330 RepID=A0A3R9WNE8_9SPHN|nr:PilZ domain-containing protein [Sphingomonas ginkgonis]RST30516.1 PilZ domain-containing protein [Sphingomonas ginkgonis]